MKTINIIFKTLASIFCLISFIFGYVSCSRFQLPYDKNGRYFDSTDMTTYNEFSVYVWGSIALIFALLSLLLFFLGKYAAWKDSDEK